MFTRKVEMQRLRVGLSANFSESVMQDPLDLWRAQISGYCWLTVYAANPGQLSLISIP